MCEVSIELCLIIAVSCLFPMYFVRIPQLCFCETHSMLLFQTGGEERGAGPKWSSRAPVYPFHGRPLFHSPQSLKLWLLVAQ